MFLFQENCFFEVWNMCLCPGTSYPLAQARDAVDNFIQSDAEKLVVIKI